MTKKINKKRVFAIIAVLTIISVSQPFWKYDFNISRNKEMGLASAATCQNECSYGQAGCGNYDSDPCLEYSGSGSGGSSSDGSSSGNATCQNECSYGQAGCGNYDSDPCLEYSGSGGTSCQNECTAGTKTCSGTSAYKTCGNYDSDPCTEWSDPISCSSGQVCSSGQCVASCQNECTSGQSQTRCSGNYVQKRTCGNCDSDPCLEWSGWSNIENCGASGWTNEYQCSGNWVQRKWINKGCSNTQCFSNSEWKNSQDCAAEGKVCQNGQCMALLSPTVDLKANGSDGPITVSYTNNITLSWNSTNAASCQASGDWSGAKSTSGSETIQMNSVKAYAFTLTCKDSTGSKTGSDSVQVNVTPNLPTVITKPAVVTY